MDTYKTATRIDDSGEIRLSALPFPPGEEVDVIVLRRDRGLDQAAESDELRGQLPPVTRRLLGIARGVTEEDYHRYLEDKHR